LEGLEISVLKLSEAFMDNEKFRIDSEFFLKKYLNAYKKIKDKPNIQLGKITSTLSDFSANGSYATIAENFTLLDEVDYAYMIRSTDLEKSDFINNVKYVSKHSYEFLDKSKLFGGEVLINKIGSPGRVYLMPSLNRPVSLGMNLFMLRLNHKENISEKFLWAYLNTNFGQKIIKRKVNGTVPLTIDKVAVKSLYVPVFSKHLIDLIESFVEASENKISLSKELYKEAENVLLKEIGLSEVELSQEGINVKSFSESFAITGRFDAEYYQPKYEQVVNKITSQPNDTLKNIVNITKSIEPGSAYYDEEGLPFMRVADFSKEGLTEPQKFLNDYFVNENKDKIKDLKPKKGTILFSKDGSVGIAYHLRQDFNGITSSAVLHLNIKDEKRIIPEYLTLALNSKLVQMQAERDAGGSIILHWRVSEIENVVVPIIDYAKQEKIAELIEESFSLKKQSEHLLEVAKKAVEIAIEENEENAIKYIKAEVN
jgi:type I restriction enzyme S subunit